MLLAWPANGWAGNDYAAVSVGYRGAAARTSAAATDVSAWNHAARLGAVVFGGDWFMKVRATLVSGAQGASARFVTDAYGGIEVGTHWPLSLGNLAVGLVVDGKRVGLEGQNGSWVVGGRGLDGGASVHFAFPAWGWVRFDPSVAAGASVLSGSAGTFSGVFVYGELEALVKVSAVVSLSFGVGFDFRTYGSTMGSDEFDARAARFDVGVAFHDVFGIGHNAF